MDADREAVIRDRNRFVADANSAVCFKFIRSASDIIDTNNIFHPEFSHQFFGDGEIIYGYSDLRVKLYYAACSLDIYFGLAFDEKAPAGEVSPDDVAGIISKQLPPGFLTNSDALVACLSKQSEFRPFGKLLHSYQREINGDKKCFEIYKVDKATPAFITHYERMQTFALWYIDAASYIDTDDPLWNYYILYERYHDDDGKVCFAFCGYSCVYHYYAYPEHVRPRIGHIFVLPPFQKRGHGFQLLQCIYNDLIHDPKVLDITAEDPSENFVMLRDHVDCINCSRLPSFQSSELKKGFSKTMEDEARKKLKISKKQARRVYEILRFKHLNAADPEEFKQFRLDIKRRLNIPFQKAKRDWVKLRKALDDDELIAVGAKEVQAEERTKQLQKQFEELLDVYRQTLNHLAVKHDLPEIRLPTEKGDVQDTLRSNGNGVEK